MLHKDYMASKKRDNLAINIETQIILDQFKPRWYQEELWDAIENEGYRKIIYIGPRREGKDLSCWNLAIRQCMKKTCLVLHCLRTYKDARGAIWDAIDSDGKSFLSYIPTQAIESINQSEMAVYFKNGSILRVAGADNYESLFRGSNPFMVIFSEFAHMEEGALAYQTMAPILAANKGIFIAITTPKGRNHAFHLFNLAKELPDWYTIHHTTSEIKHIDEEELELIKQTMNPELYAQEFECSFSRGIEGAYYMKDIDRLKLNNQITNVPWEPHLLTHIAIDIGVRDATTIIWYQVIGDGIQIRIIDCWSMNGIGLDEVVRVVKSKPYWSNMGKIYAPHDLAVREWGGGAVTRFELARRAELNFNILEQTDLYDGIENVHSKFQNLWIDETKCKALLSALENYRREWDEARQMYDNKPVKNWACHYADALRYLCQSIHKTKKGMTSEEFERKKYEAIYNNKGALPRVFDSKFDRLR